MSEIKILISGNRFHEKEIKFYGKKKDCKRK